MPSVDLNLQHVLQVAQDTLESFHLLGCPLDLTVAAAFTNGTFLKNCLHLRKLRRLLLELHNIVFPITSSRRSKSYRDPSFA